MRDQPLKPTPKPSLAWTLHIAHGVNDLPWAPSSLSPQTMGSLEFFLFCCTIVYWIRDPPSLGNSPLLWSPQAFHQANVIVGVHPILLLLVVVATGCNCLQSLLKMVGGVRTWNMCTWMWRLSLECIASKTVVNNNGTIVATKAHNGWATSATGMNYSPPTDIEWVNNGWNTGCRRQYNDNRCRWVMTMLVEICGSNGFERDSVPVNRPVALCKPVFLNCTVVKRSSTLFYNNDSCFW